MNNGVSPLGIFQALKINGSRVDAIQKTYNPVEPRVAAGSGATSGEWTSDGGPLRVSLSGALVTPAATSLGDLAFAAVESLGEYALRLLARSGGPAVTAFGLLFISSPNDLRVEGEVPGVPGLSYAWNRDETLLHLNCDDADGERSSSTEQLEDDVFRDKNGRIVARILPGGNIVVDKAAVSPNSANDNEPKSRSRKSAQGDKWSFCLTAGKIGPRIRRGHEQTSAPDAHTGLQGEGGACGHQGRADAGSAG